MTEATWHERKRKATVGNNANRSKVSQSVIPSSTTQKASNVKLLPSVTLYQTQRDAIIVKMLTTCCTTTNFNFNSRRMESRQTNITFIFNGIHFAKICDHHSQDLRSKKEKSIGYLWCSGLSGRAAKWNRKKL